MPSGSCRASPTRDIRTSPVGPIWVKWLDKRQLIEQLWNRSSSLKRTWRWQTSVEMKHLLHKHREGLPGNQYQKPKHHYRTTTAQVEYRTPAASKFVSMGKENITPSTTGSRRAKDAATAKLHELTPDIQRYEKERKRVGGVVFGGRRKKDEDRVEVARKRSAEDVMDVDDEEEVESKKPRKGLPPPAMHLLISSYKKWIRSAEGRGQ